MWISEPADEQPPAAKVHADRLACERELSAARSPTATSPRRAHPATTTAVRGSRAPGLGRRRGERRSIGLAPSAAGTRCASGEREGSRRRPVACVRALLRARCRARGEASLRLARPCLRAFQVLGVVGREDEQTDHYRDALMANCETGALRRPPAFVLAQAARRAGPPLVTEQENTLSVGAEVSNSRSPCGVRRITPSARSSADYLRRRRISSRPRVGRRIHSPVSG